MSKEVLYKIKLEIKGNAANPAPPIGPALGSKGVNIMEFCKQFNARTKDNSNKVFPVVISVYKDKSFDFIIKSPKVSLQLLELAKINSGSAQPNRNKIANISIDDIKTIAESKISEMNSFTIESAIRMVEGTARSMGINVLKNN